MLSIVATAQRRSADPGGEPSALTLALLMAGAFTCPMSTWTLFHGYLSVSDAFFLAALLGHSRTGLNKLQAFSAIPVSLVAAGILFAFSGMVTWALGGPHSDPLNAAKLVFSLTIFPILILVTAGTAIRHLERLMAAWLAGATLSAAVAFISSHGVSIPGLYDKAAAAGGRAQGLAYVHNALGYTSALLAPVAIYFWSRHRRLSWRVLAVLSLALLVYALDASGSRAALLALALGLLVPAMHLLRRYLSAALVTAVLGIAAAATLAATVALELDIEVPRSLSESAFGRLFGISDASASNSERQIYIDYAWGQFQDQPVLGSGYYLLRLSHMHVLGVMQCGGLLGLSAFMLWVLAVLGALRNVGGGLARSRPQTEAYYGLWACALSGFVVWAVDGALQPLLLDRNGYILIGVLFALNARIRQRTARRTRPAELPSIG